MSGFDLDAVRAFWDADAGTYDRTENHAPRRPEEVSAWSAALARHLPAAPARVLDAGAGTGFLALTAARLGHRVTALDLSAAMLERLTAKAGEEGLEVEAVNGPADEPPVGPFDAVVERHLLWTLPDPAGALEAWRRVAPEGRLVLVESEWGAAGGPGERLRARARAALRRRRGTASDHHAEYAPGLRAALPLGAGPSAARLAEVVAGTAWGPARVERLRDVERAATAGRPLVDRLLGVPPRFVVVAGR